MLFKKQLNFKPKGKRFTQKCIEDNAWLTSQRHNRSCCIFKDAVPNRQLPGVEQCLSLYLFVWNLLIISN